MTMKIDAFAHLLLPRFYEKMLAIKPELPQMFPFINHPHLLDFDKRRAAIPKDVKQIVSYVNINPEDYTDPETAANLCVEANNELIQAVESNSDIFAAGIAMIPMNNIPAAQSIIETVSKSHTLVGIQIFTRALGKSIADPQFRDIFEACARLNVPLWMHPIFDERKPDNNIVFSWEYELTQAMLQLVQVGIYKDFPDLKIIVHHAGAMVPFFRERMRYTMPADQFDDFHKFYVDTALLGNAKALELAEEFYGMDHIVFGTDAPLGIPPAGSTHAIIKAIEELPFVDTDKQKIFSTNIESICHRTF
ncbi:amidohydrolase [Alloscardovia theropitheci]|uniref:Amidohydrolase n=1 Tax=Alloscardovia theropitheci TaxID=2496842 RepID=A0A4R0QRM6_9BIFI|nr:amidohydrolase family protein [Alloscardovia theropitheci]TCD55032.1 amidohydrolase [Alloscardovia theropitheci]